MEIAVLVHPQLCDLCGSVKSAVTTGTRSFRRDCLSVISTQHGSEGTCSKQAVKEKLSLFALSMSWISATVVSHVSAV